MKLMIIEVLKENDLLHLLIIEILFYLSILLIIIINMFCIKFQGKHQNKAKKPIKIISKKNNVDDDDDDKCSLIKLEKLPSHQLLRHHIVRDHKNNIYLVPNGLNSHCTEPNELIQLVNSSTVSYHHHRYHQHQEQQQQQQTLPVSYRQHFHSLKDNIVNKFNTSKRNQSKSIEVNSLVTKIHVKKEQNSSNKASYSFVIWFIKFAQRLFRWKQIFPNVNIATKQINTQTVNSHLSNEYPNSIDMNTSHQSNFHKDSTLKQRIDDENLLMNILNIKQKSNSWKEQSRKSKLYHDSFSWIETKSGMYPCTNTNSTLHYHLSPYKQFNSQSDLYDPIYSCIQYPLNDILQSIHSSTSSWNHSSMSIHQPYKKDYHLVKSIWTSQDSIVSDCHVYCELINMKSNQLNCYYEKKINSQLNCKQFSCCTLYSYENTSFHNNISDEHLLHSVNMKQLNLPPILPLRNYGESTLNMVETIRLRTLRNKQKHIKNRYKLNKLHNHVHSMFDMTWRLDKQQNDQEFFVHSSLKTFYQYCKQKYLKKQNFLEKSIDYDELISNTHSTDHQTRSIYSEFDAVISLDHINSSDIRDRLHGEDQDQVVSKCYSNEAFTMESQLHLQKSSTNFNEICNNFRYIDSDIDISELSPSISKSPRSIQSKQNNSINSYLTSPSFTPLYHIYIPNYCNRIQNQQTKESNKIYNQTFSQNKINQSLVSKTKFPEDNHYSSLHMPPLMERSMEDDECYLCR
ncbi:hypothetical protein MN116_008797 [Schistosoma mekongi]|uniref:Uncharacterized protein n=1 Tax=Schistosoma mekongi TaxID=38744 RepID=A0AAE1Z6P9_SCHME|nr:hypothetical protein MN116_008797 [Schistosoma mekongi]